MKNFPNIAAQSIRVTTIKPVNKSQYQGGYEQTNLKHTRRIKMFSLGFDALKNSDADNLEQFFNENQSIAFIYHHERTSTNYTVKFNMSEISFNEVSPLYQSTQVVLKEV